MEFPSLKTPVILENMRRLKQATLPFETLKVNSRHEPSLYKSEEVNDCDLEELPIKSENTQLMEVVDVEINESLNDCLNKDGTEIGSKKLSEVQIIECSINKDDNVKLNETEYINKQDTGTPLNEPCEKINLNLNKVVNKNISDQDNNVINNKRKLESNQPAKEQKPPKRAKLIYHIDKLKKCDDNTSESKVEVKSLESVSASCADNVDVKLKEEVLGKKIEPTLLHNKLEEVNSLKRKCNTECNDATIKEVKVSVSRNSEEDCSTPNSKGNSLSSGKSSAKKLTPKQLERRAELIKRKESMLLEKERKKKEKEEEKVRIKQEKEEFKKKLKEEKEKKRQAEIELKSEEKRRKEEERKKKEEQKQEDKRRKEEQKLEDKRKREELLKKKEEEEELLKKKITKEAEAFSSFFKKYDVKIPTAKEDSTSSTEIIFMPFTVKADMRLAPINRNPMGSERFLKFEKLYSAQCETVTYLQQLRSGAILPEKRGNTWPLEEKYDEGLIILDEGLDLKNEVATVPKKTFSDRRPKLLQFYENRRPPYWGTWRKKSKIIRPKNPLGKDDIFEYDVDSDDEWEEEEPGESLRGSDDEKESEDEYEVDNEFFVPHGYLSEDENPEEEIISPETQKAKLKLLGELFDLERNEKTKLLKPITLGCIWFNSISDEPDNVNPSIVKFLSKRKAVPWVDNTPILLTAEENLDSNELSAGDNDTPSSNKKATFPVAAIPDLITLIHGSTKSRKNLVKTFLLDWMKKKEDKIAGNEDNAVTLSQARVLKKIKELANWGEFPEEGPSFGKRCWYVKRDIREKFGLGNLSVSVNGEALEGKEMDGLKKGSPSLITKFTKVLTEDERRNQMMKCNARKSVLPSNLTIEKTPTSPKSQFKSMKCVRKLKDFWTKPATSEKLSENESIPSEKMDEDVVEVSSQNGENVVSC